MNNDLSKHWTLNEEKLAAYVLNKIDEKEKLVLANHLETCADCRKRVQEEREILEGIRRYGRSEMKQRLKLRLRRDQRRRFEWINAASIAAAVVIMLGGVFATRWLFDFKPQKSDSIEIVLSEPKETEPGMRPLWIIGRIIEVSDIPESGESIAFADEIRSETIMQNNELPDKTDSRGKIESKLDSPSSPADNEYIASYDKELENIKQKTAPASTASVAEPQKGLSAKSEDTRLARIGTDSLANVSGKAAASRESPTAIAEVKIAEQEAPVKKTRSAFSSRKRRLLKNIQVRRGNIEDLPASLRTADASAVHTQMERNERGLLLTFYSNAIKDTVASIVEAVTKDSIIVTFRDKQIGYYIPGGI
ncbi:MAG: zf-HC2 domain-containing protein [Bacteroidetes bacterium]|nr:zf-HC2 domain-containing protein [Bacteroidota bacterium]